MLDNQLHIANAQLNQLAAFLADKTKIDLSESIGGILARVIKAHASQKDSADRQSVAQKVRADHESAVQEIFHKHGRFLSNVGLEISFGQGPPITSGISIIRISVGHQLGEAQVTIYDAGKYIDFLSRVSLIKNLEESQKTDVKTLMSAIHHQFHTLCAEKEPSQETLELLQSFRQIAEHYRALGFTDYADSITHSLGFHAYGAYAAAMLYWKIQSTIECDFSPANWHIDMSHERYAQKWKTLVAEYRTIKESNLPGELCNELFESVESEAELAIGTLTRILCDETIRQNPNLASVQIKAPQFLHDVSAALEQLRTIGKRQE